MPVVVELIGGKVWSRPLWKLRTTDTSLSGVTLAKAAQYLIFSYSSTHEMLRLESLDFDAETIRKCFWSRPTHIIIAEAGLFASLTNEHLGLC